MRNTLSGLSGDQILKFLRFQTGVMRSQIITPVMMLTTHSAASSVIWLLYNYSGLINSHKKEIMTCLFKHAFASANANTSANGPWICWWLEGPPLGWLHSAVPIRFHWDRPPSSSRRRYSPQTEADTGSTFWVAAVRITLQLVLQLLDINANTGNCTNQ